MKPFVLGIFSVLALGCGAAATSNPRAELQILRREHSTDKLVQRGLGFAEIGDLTRAEQYLVAALEQGAAAQQVVPRLLHVCLAATRHRAALVYAREYGSVLSRDPKFIFLVAMLESAVGDPDRAIEHLRQSARLMPEHADAHYQLALLLEGRDGAQPEIALHLREYLRLAPQGRYADDARSKLNDSCTFGDCPPTALGSR